jgi:hypothetical protein
MQIKVYHLVDGGWSLDGADGAIEQEAELADGYKVSTGFYDGRRIIYRSQGGELGMNAEQAIVRRVLRIC